VGAAQNVIQPVVESETEARHPVEVYMELATRLGKLEPFMERFNAGLGLKEAQRMEVTRSYSVAEILDRHIKSTVGDEFGLDRLRETGFVSFPRTQAEKFPRALKKLPRVPVYFEFLLDTGAEFDKTAAELKLALDGRSFRALPVWHPCAAQERAPAAYDLIAVNYKLPFQTSTTTQYNPWLAELSERHRLALYVTLNRKTASEHGIADGDEIELAGTNGYTARGTVRVSECVHPEVAAVASCFGHWSHNQPSGGTAGVNFNAFVPLDVSGMEMLSGSPSQRFWNVPERRRLWWGSR